MENQIEQTRIEHSRFSDATWYSTELRHVIIGGAGGIGSWTALLLARAGFVPIVYDFDCLEEVNMAGQLYSRKEIGNDKVEALSKMILEFASVGIVALNEKYDELSMTHKYVIAAFDNMKARKIMFDLWILNEHNKDGLFIDARLNAEHMWIFCVKHTEESIEEYRKNLFDDSEIPDAPCTFKQTSHSAAMVSSHIVGFFTNYLTNLKVNSEDREVPFCWEYNIPLNLVTITDNPQKIIDNVSTDINDQNS